MEDLLFVDKCSLVGMYDNDSGFDGSRGAFVVSLDGASVLRVGVEHRFLRPSLFNCYSGRALCLAHAMLWTAVHLRGDLPVVSAGGLLSELNGQVPNEVVRFCALPGSVAWDYLNASAIDLPVIAPPSSRFWPEGIGPGPWGDVIIWLPSPEKLGVCVNPSDGVFGLFLFSRMVSAVRVPR